MLPETSKSSAFWDMGVNSHLKWLFFSPYEVGEWGWHQSRNIILQVFNTRSTSGAIPGLRHSLNLSIQHSKICFIGIYLWPIPNALGGSFVLLKRQNYLPLITNVSQKLTQPSKGISYQVADLYRRFTNQALPSAYTLHSNPIPPTDGTNGFL